MRNSAVKNYQDGIQWTIGESLMIKINDWNTFIKKSISKLISILIEKH